MSVHNVNTRVFIWDTINKKIIDDPFGLRRLIYSFTEFTGNKICTVNTICLTNEFSLGDFYQLYSDKNLVFYTKDDKIYQDKFGNIGVSILD